MEKVLLNMKAISKTFGSVQALKEVSLDLYAGEVLALMGENGAGKSTLMNILSGSLQPTKGEIYLKGEKVTVPGPIAAKKLGISKIHQELQIVPEMSVAENIILGRWMKKKGGSVDFKTMAAEARKYLEMLDVHVDPATKLKDLRIGEQQLVEIAKAISLNSEIIIMDEPTSAISEKEAEKLFTIIRKLRSEGKGIIYITHRMEEIFQIADRLTVMRDGTYIGTVKASETSKDEIIKMMVGRDMSEQYPKDPTEKGEIALKVENLTYTPPAGSFRRSLKNISLHVRHGEVLGIAGLAGAGRSELFECLAGVHYKDTTAKIFQIILSKTRFGRQVYAIGGNKNAAYLSGIKVDRIKIYAFMICAMLSSVAAMIHAAQISQGGPNEGQGYELNAVAACAIGGTSLAGGKGTVFGTLIGALILGMLDNVLGLKGVNSNLQLMVKGFLIIIAVFMQADKVND